MSPTSTPGTRAHSRIEQTVATWPRWAQEAFIERAGILLDSGVAPQQADQMAFLWTGKRRQARAEKGGGE